MHRVFGHAIVSILFLLSGAGISSAEDAAPKPPANGLTAQQVMRQVADVYKSCKSYSDSGEVRTITFMKTGRRIDLLYPFTTAFVRPDRFRFEYSSKFPISGAKPMRHIVWAKGKEVRTWWELRPGINKEESLGLALAGATGVSGGSAHTIPVLLMPENIGGSSVTQLRQPHRIADAPLGDVACYRIQGTRGSVDSGPVTLWISKNTFLIHRIDKSHKFAEFRTETTTTYTPEVDAMIEDSKLTFNAPEEAGKE